MSLNAKIIFQLYEYSSVYKTVLILYIIYNNNNEVSIVFSYFSMGNFTIIFNDLHNLLIIMNYRSEY